MKETEEFKYKGFITFGSNHLKGFRVSPMLVMLIVEGNDFFDARQRLMDNEDLGIGNVFAFQYDMKEAAKMEVNFGMKLYTQNELKELK